MTLTLKREYNNNNMYRSNYFVYFRSLTAKTVEDSSNNQPQARDNRLPATSDV